MDRGRGYYSPELSDASLASLEQRIGVSNARTAWDAGEAARRLRKLVADAAAGLSEDEPEPVDLVALDEARLDDLRLDFESLLVRHLADLRAGGERVPDDPVLDLYFSFARFHDVSKRAQPEGGRPDPAFDVLAARGKGRRAARDPLQGPVEASRRDPERGGGHGLDVRDALPAGVLPRSARTRPRPHVGAPPALALSAGEPLRVRRAGRGHDVRGARARRPAPRGPRRGRGARVPGQRAGAVSVVPLSRRGARPPADPERAPRPQAVRPLERAGAELGPLGDERRRRSRRPPRRLRRCVRRRRGLSGRDAPGRRRRLAGAAHGPLRAGAHAPLLRGALRARLRIRVRHPRHDARRAERGAPHPLGHGHGRRRPRLQAIPAGSVQPLPPGRLVPRRPRRARVHRDRPGDRGVLPARQNGRAAGRDRRRRLVSARSRRHQLRGLGPESRGGNPEPRR